MKKEPVLTTHQATAQGMTTLVGFYGPFPRERGNCFSVYVGPIETKEDYLRAKSFKIINFGAENLEYLLEKKVITWPIEIAQLDDTYLAKIVDKRIPADFFDAKPCSICTSKKYWTPEMRKKRADDIRSGDLKISKPITMEDGTKMRVERRRFHAATKPLKLTIDKEVDQTLELDKEGFINVPFLPKTEMPSIDGYMDKKWIRITALVAVLLANIIGWGMLIRNCL